MKKFTISILSLLVYLVASFTNLASGQRVPTIQDCLGAIQICDRYYEEVNSPRGMGNFLHEIHSTWNGGDVCAGEDNSIWYTFTVRESGKFGFVLTPKEPTDDYDWVLLDLTNANCEDIYANIDLVVSCNAAGANSNQTHECSGATGATGGSQYNNQGGGCGNRSPNNQRGFSPFNDLIDVEAGNTYVLMVSNWTGSPHGYDIDFGLGTDIGVIDEEEPSIVLVDIPIDCNIDDYQLEFSEPIQCTTIQNSNFLLSGPNGDHEILLDVQECADNELNSKIFSFQTNPKIKQEGEYTLTLVTDDTDQVLDRCGNQSENLEFNFTYESPFKPIVDLGPDTLVSCVGMPIEFDVTDPNATGYLWQDGSTDATFVVTQTGLYHVELMHDCFPSYDTIFVEIEEIVPITLELGLDTTICDGMSIDFDVTHPDALEYVWEDGVIGAQRSISSSGKYRVVLSNNCFSIEDSIEITVLPIEPLSIDIGVDTIVCDYEELELVANHPDADSYTWSTGSVSDRISVNQAGEYSVILENECAIFYDTIVIDYYQNQDIGVNLGHDTILCPGNTLTLSGFHPNADEYLWQDGSTNEEFEVTENGVYYISLQNECWQVSDTIVVDFYQDQNLELSLGQDTILCPGEIIVLDVDHSNADNYLWQDSSLLSMFQIEKPGQYHVTISNECREISDTIEVDFHIDQDLFLSLGNDTTLCPGEVLELDISHPNADDYTWQNNSSSPIFVISNAGEYSVELSNECNVVHDTISVSYFSNQDLSIDLGTDTTLCPQQTLILDAFHVNADAYHWQDESENQDYNVNNAGVYIVSLSNECNLASDTIHVAYHDVDPIVVDHVEEAEVCPDVEYTIHINNHKNQNTILWNDGSTSFEKNILNPGEYNFELSNACYSQSGSFTLGHYDLVELIVDIGEDTTICEGNSFDLDVDLDSEYVSYLWSNGETSPTIRISDQGIYTIQLSDICGNSAVDEKRVKIFEHDYELDLGEDIVLCIGDTLVLDVFENELLSYEWNTGENTSDFSITVEGEYSLIVQDLCYEYEDEIYVSELDCEPCNFYIPNIFDPNDSKNGNDYFMPFSNCDFLDYKLQMFDRWGAKIFESNENNPSWNGTYKGKILNPGVYSYRIDLRYLEIGEVKTRSTTGSVLLVN